MQKNRSTERSGEVNIHSTNSLNHKIVSLSLIEHKNRFVRRSEAIATTLAVTISVVSAVALIWFGILLISSNIVWKSTVKTLTIQNMQFVTHGLKV
jgi:hypothetical protein